MQHYARSFDTVEVNNTFYRLPLETSVARWVEETPPGFVLAVKASRYLTHVKRLADLDAGDERYYERLRPLVWSPKLGPVLWPLPANFRRDDERLAAVSRRVAAGPSLLRVSARELVRRAGVRASARARRCARDRRSPGSERVPDVRTHDPLDLRPLPLRITWPGRQLQRARAGGVGSALRGVAS
ncbi:MAG: DUF72 domain-containing protein [Actinobacteria bacterium]|nr:DUF72 domain-containing protein [Actinomycetota bacterium]